MSNSADRMRDTIHEVATGDMASVVDELARLADSLNRHGGTQDRAITALFDTVAEQGDAILALSNRVEGVLQHGKGLADAMATRADLDDLRHEVMEAVATPFDPPEAA